MRALLVVNPVATTTSPRTRDVITRALANGLDLEVMETRYRGHGKELARRAAEEKSADLVIALGGDGTVNEVVNGLLHRGPDPEHLPGLAVVPGGSTNVFARALGLPNEPVEATGALLDALRAGRTRTIGLGLASGTPGTLDAEVPARWFTFCAGLGFDAGVVGRVEAQRERGKRSTHPLYVRQVVRQFLADHHGRTHGTIALKRPGHPAIEGLALSIVCNTSPWSFLGNRPLYAAPGASFDTALDVLGITKLSVGGAARYAAQLVRSTPQRGPRGRNVVSLHDETEFTLQSQAPLPFQLDGDHLGLRTSVTFTGERRALRVIV
ncbi:diacylglycerol kinase family protein [Streptomyces sp. 7-21]|uniref:diacylglycerol/lipid kinase family protein n=1 Tax=Streptomyces sp. 7-21 TaxID=2802283 RepID=UPI00191D30CC|nr:diacylglycerol kinase family protein [Streptomyces sp. 7-21]MBL1065093.1 diacylglycerol kinase family lipid kinase [Streptomyces sp. 7-21]